MCAPCSYRNRGKLAQKHPFEDGKLRSAGMKDIISYREIIMGSFFTKEPWCP